MIPKPPEASTSKPGCLDYLENTFKGLVGIIFFFLDQENLVMLTVMGIVLVISIVTLPCWLPIAIVLWLLKIPLPIPKPSKPKS